MIEKPKSNKAKSHYKHNSLQDHGSAAQRKGHLDEDGYWGNRWERRGVESADKTYLKEIIRDGLDDYYKHMTPAELEHEADIILDEVDSDDDEIFQTESHRNPYDYGYYDANDGQYFEADYSHNERLKKLAHNLKDLKNRIKDMPSIAGDDSFNQQRFAIEAEIDETIAEIRFLLNEHDYPEAAFGVNSVRNLRNRNERDATEGDYSEDDYGDTESAVGMRISRKI